MNRMKNCWKVLGIPPTRDRDVVQKTYRDLVKKYHPDKARSPEKVRHYTIKCAEINGAYRQALIESEGAAPREPAAPQIGHRSEAQRGSRPNRLGSAIAFIFVALGLSAWGEILFGLKIGPLNFAIGMFRWFDSLPLESVAREVLSGVLAIPAGIILGGMAAMLGPILLPVLVIGWFENTDVSKYSYKVALVLLTVAQYFAVYRAGYHWPFEHRVNAYYEMLNDVAKVAGWLYLPLAGLWLWALEYYRYARVKKSCNFLSVLP